MKVHYFESKDRNFKEFMDHVCAYAVQQKIITKKLKKQILAREQKASLYVGNGLIIPHPTENGRKEIIGESSLIINWFKKPLLYRGHQVYFSITILVNQNKHMEILSRIATIFSQQELVEQIKRQMNEVNIRKVLKL